MRILIPERVLVFILIPDSNRWSNTPDPDTWRWDSGSRGGDP